jgi:hypothetical protein
VRWPTGGCGGLGRTPLFSHSGRCKWGCRSRLRAPRGCPRPRSGYTRNAHCPPRTTQRDPRAGVIPQALPVLQARPRQALRLIDRQHPRASPRAPTTVASAGAELRGDRPGGATASHVARTGEVRTSRASAGSTTPATMALSPADNSPGAGAGLGRPRTHEPRQCPSPIQLKQPRHQHRYRHPSLTRRHCHDSTDTKPRDRTRPSPPRHYTAVNPPSTVRVAP